MRACCSGASPIPGDGWPVTFPRRLEDSPAFAYYPGEREGVAVRRGDLRRLPPLRPPRRRAAVPVRLWAVLHRLRVSRPEGAGRRAATGRPVAAAARRAERGNAREGGSSSSTWPTPQASLPRPPRELKAFRKVTLKPGESGGGSSSRWTFALCRSTTRRGAPGWRSRAISTCSSAAPRATSACAGDVRIAVEMRRGAGEIVENSSHAPDALAAEASGLKEQAGRTLAAWMGSRANAMALFFTRTSVCI